MICYLQGHLCHHRQDNCSIWTRETLAAFAAAKHLPHLAQMSLEFVNLEDVHGYEQTKTIEAARKHLCAVRDRSQIESEPHGRTLQQISATRLFHEDLVLLVTGLLGRLKAGGQLSLIGYGEGQGAIIASLYVSFSEALPNFSAWSGSPSVVTQIVEG